MKSASENQASQITISRHRCARNILSNVSLLLVSIVAALALAEIYFRLVDPQPIIPRYVETSRYGIRKNIANVRGEMIVSEYRHEFSTNSEGFRGTREYSVDKPPEVYRIIVLGDSTTLGHGVGDKGTFSFLLQELLSEKRPTEVINMGVSGFGTAEELIQLRNVGLMYNPDLVILAYFQNDPYNNTVSQLFKLVDGKLVQNQEAFVPAIFVRDRLYAIPGYSFLAQHSHVVNLIRNRFSAYYTNQLGQQHNVSSETRSTLRLEQAELTAALINEIINETIRRHVLLILLNIPLIHEGKSVSNLPIDLVHHLEPYVHVVDVDQQIYKGHPMKEISYEKDSHPKPLAHRLIAEWLASYIQTKGFASELADAASPFPLETP